MNNCPHETANKLQLSRQNLINFNTDKPPEASNKKKS